ncbi:MAG: hypothetical protein DRG83_03630 [Deltaproteobacteria bacterium]|nr:MAG: hypothetical protein DRG83_03630 [Deltaproteobacteria bacterium]
MNKKVKVVGCQKGAALIVSVLVLLVLTVIGIYAVTTSTLETKISGSFREYQTAFFAADSGTEYGRRVIEIILHNEHLPSDAHPDPDEDHLREEILGSDTSGNPKVKPAIGTYNTEITINRLKTIHMPGGSAEFGGQEVKIAIFYEIDSKVSSRSGAEVTTIYRRMAH